MGQKVNPTGLRLGINRTWDSRWYAGKKEYGKLLQEDIKIREYLSDKLKAAGVSRIVIERPHKKCRVTIHSARPGVVIGKKVDRALNELTFSQKRIARDVKKVLQSAVANAENNHDLDVDDLVVREASVGKNLVMKRFHARARGNSGGIEKFFSQITIVVEEKREEAPAKTESETKSAAKPVAKKKSTGKAPAKKPAAKKPAKEKA